MYHDTGRPLSFETLLCDPLTRLVMDADGVSVDEFAAVRHAARDAVAARGRRWPMCAIARLHATNAPA